jgi:hypothetical protein
MRLLQILFFTIIFTQSFASQLLIPMDMQQKNHLKAYGIAYFALQKGVEIKWLLNYRGGSFMMEMHKELETECVVRDVSFEVIAEAQASLIISDIARAEVNMDALKLEVAPRIAVYSPKNKLPWDDAVTLALTYAEIPFDVIYDEEIIEGKLSQYDWLHLHHEDFTGQFGKFWGSFRNQEWYKEDERLQTETAHKHGFKKVSELKLFVAVSIRDFVSKGGFLFAMCSATDSYDIALAAENIDICREMFDGDPMDPAAQSKLDYEKTFAFKDFILETNPGVYEYSTIDVTNNRKLNENEDFFTLFDFSAKWDPVPTMLCQNHVNIVKGFMGQTTAFDKKYIKSSVLVMGENKSANEARYVHGDYGQGTWTFYGGHDPEDYRHFVGDPQTNLDLHPHSPGYRLILNNILFPAAKKKKQKT